MRPICKIECILENLAKKHSICPKLGAFCRKMVGYRDGPQNHAFRGIEMVEILNSTLSIPVQIFFEEPPPGNECRATSNAMRSKDILLSAFDITKFA